MYNKFEKSGCLIFENPCAISTILIHSLKKKQKTKKQVFTEFFYESGCLIGFRDIELKTSWLLIPGPHDLIWDKDTERVTTQCHEHMLQLRRFQLYKM